MAPPSDLTAEVLYDQVEEKARHLPVRVTLCDRGWSDDVQVTAVNDVGISPIAFQVDAMAQEGACQVATGGIDLKALTQHFAEA